MQKTNIQKRSVIIFTHFLGWINENKASKIFGLDLLEEYTFPQPMPEDKFYDYHIETNQAYLMLATEGTGIYLICIMFNSTFRGRNTKKFEYLM